MKAEGRYALRLLRLMKQKVKEIKFEDPWSFADISQSFEEFTICIFFGHALWQPFVFDERAARTGGIVHINALCEELLICKGKFFLRNIRGHCIFQPGKSQYEGAWSGVANRK